ncbi:hypothetical protein Tco_0121781 [Tanacetum coccineum]
MPPYDGIAYHYNYNNLLPGGNPYRPLQLSATPAYSGGPMIGTGCKASQEFQVSFFSPEEGSHMENSNVYKKKAEQKLGWRSNMEVIRRMLLKQFKEAGHFAISLLMTLEENHTAYCNICQRSHIGISVWVDVMHDVARGAYDIGLTEPGLSVIVNAILTNRGKETEAEYRREVGETKNFYLHEEGNREIKEIVTKIEGTTLCAKGVKNNELAKKCVSNL